MAERISIGTAVARALQLERDGADILDVAAIHAPRRCSVSRKGVRRSAGIELLRGQASHSHVGDTQKAEVAESALAAGAEI